MTFDDILAQVLALLQREGRVSYRALKVRFQLDDDLLEAVQDELIYAKHLAVDENNRVLVWRGDVEGTAETASQRTQLTQQALIQDDQPTQGVPLPTESRIPEAERRQLTVMFCDLVDSTVLSGQLDPEDFREVVRAYQRVCSEVITRFDGYIAQLLGDGLLVYFGYPQAHEDDAQRAVRTGLGILDVLGDLNKRLEHEKGITLALRLGIHTGLVVVGAMGGGSRQEQLALGETPNITARIQGLANANTLVISEATYRLIQGYFYCKALGEQTLRGVTHPLSVYRILGESGVHSRLDVAQLRGLTPLVGRQQEVGLLLERWIQVKDGHGQIVLLSGEGGIGKSRLIQVLKEHVTGEQHVWLECRSSPYYQNTALFPLVDLFQRLLRFEAHEMPHAKLAKLEQTLSQYRLPSEESVQLFAPLLSLPVPAHHYPQLHLSPQMQRQKTLEAFVAILLELAEHQPVLFILEDLHWTDPTTLEFLALLIDQTPTASLLVLLTCRPTFQPRWSHRSYLTEVTVNRLFHTHVEQIVTGITEGKTFPAEVLQQIIEKTDGVPLFVEEMTKALLESGHLQAVDGHYELVGSGRTLTIPATLQDSLMARLDRLVTAKGVAQIGATIGRRFTYALLHAVSPLEEATLQRELSRLVDTELVYQRGIPPQATYMFKHALIRDAAYESLLKSTRQHYHQCIAHVLEAQFPDTANYQPELLAYHYTEAGGLTQAVDYWQQAGQRAIERSAHVEAIAHLQQGLALLQTLPETPERFQHEVDLLLALGISLNATKGGAVPEVEATYIRARSLCHALDDPHRLFPVLRGLWNCYGVRGALPMAHALAEQLLALAQQTQDPVMLPVAHRALGTTCFYLGAPAEASTHLTQSMALYDPQQHRAAAFLYGEDTGVTGLSRIAWVLWYRGYPDQGLARNNEAVTLAHQIMHPLSVSWALGFAAIFHVFRREVWEAQDRAAATISFAEDQGFPYSKAIGSLLRGWALVHQGQVQEGIAQLHQGLMALRAAGADVGRPYWLALLAEAHGMMGQPEAGLTVLAEALTLTDTTGERWSEAELHRLKGELLLQQSSDNQVEAETCFQHAIRIAQSQQAKSWELRASTSLARLGQRQGKRQEAHDLLASVYNWFTEGFDTADLQDAKALLNELA